MAKPDMHEMARADEDQEGSMPAVPPSVHIGHDDLQQIGIKDGPAPGEVYHLSGHARVISASENPDTGEKSASFHFTHMHDAKQIKESEAGKGVRDTLKDAMASHDDGKDTDEKS